MKSIKSYLPKLYNHPKMNISNHQVIESSKTNNTHLIEDHSSTVRSEGNLIQISSPTRVDLAGGTLDLWPLYNFTNGSATTINMAIDISTFVEIRKRNDKKIEIYSSDLQLKKEYKDWEDCLHDADPRLDLLKLQIQYWKPQHGFELTTRSQSPVGGGLGGSSSLTISLLKAFQELTGQYFANVHEMVRVAHNLEAQVLRTPTGTQDYYPAAVGGLNIIKYSADGIQLEVLDRDIQFFADRCLVVYTGKSHHSGINNFQVLSRAVQGDSQTLRALKEIHEIAEEMDIVIRESHWNRIANLFKREFTARVQLAEAFSSPEIDKLHEISIKAGAEALKICGAGGGGCVLIWTSPEKKEAVQNQCIENGFQVLPARPMAQIQSGKYDG